MRHLSEMELHPFASGELVIKPLGTLVVSHRFGEATLSHVAQALFVEVLRRKADGLLEFDVDIVSIGADARLVLGEEIRHSILSLTVNDNHTDQ